VTENKGTRVVKISKNKWLTCFNAKTEADTNIICFPFGGAGASVYKPWDSELPDNIRLWSVQLPGRENRFAEGFTHDYNSIVKGIVDDIMALKLDNIVLFGHSMGAHIALFVAEKLHKNHAIEPLLLAVSGNTPPSINVKKSWSTSTDNQLRDHLKKLGGIPSEVADNRDFLDMYMEKIRADYTLIECRPSREVFTLPIPLLALYGKDDPLFPTENMKEWCQYTSEDSKVLEFSGAHFYFQQDCRLIVQAVCMTLDKLLTE